MTAAVAPIKRRGQADSARSLVAVASVAPALSNELVMISEPAGARAEAIRALRTYIMTQHVQGGRRALAICGASIDVGCTFVAANLAVALSQIGLKTLLIDGDLRRPAVDGLIRPVRSSIGLQQFLASADMDISEAIEAEVTPNLSVLHAGGPASNPQELLASSRFEDLMEVCMRDYDMTIVDTPPANLCADARRIGNVAGYALVVARRNRSLIDDVKTLVGELEGDHVHVVGSVLNEA
ncbi:MAG: CpsD/CapB family tyrosine-protein kinase [Phenylobacterium sp.]|uniref:CpsD/CapB family tyrosine-protein kinase n=1 Tax=Phenylobacterium sp. TaxID=1871053 RepID=UPI00391BD737